MNTQFIGDTSLASKHAAKADNNMFVKYAMQSTFYNCSVYLIQLHVMETSTAVFSCHPYIPMYFLLRESYVKKLTPAYGMTPRTVGKYPR